MRIGSLLLTVAIVATGIFLYDVLRREPARPVHAPLDVPVERVREEPRPEAQPTLSGSGLEDLARRIEDLEERLAALPPAGVPRVDVVGDSSRTAPAGSPARAPEPPPSSGPESLADVSDAKNPDPRTVQWFRAYMDEVDRIRGEERRISQEKARLARIEGLSLSTQEEEAVIAATLRYRTSEQARMRELVGRQGVTREAREALQAEARGEYVRELEKIVPSSDAEKIADGMARPRFNPARRFDRRSEDTPAAGGR